jgi:hypothetical protein
MAQGSSPDYDRRFDEIQRSLREILQKLDDVVAQVGRSARELAGERTGPEGVAVGVRRTRGSGPRPGGDYTRPDQVPREELDPDGAE